MTTAPHQSVPFMDLRRQHDPLADDLRAAFERVLGASSFILGEEVETFETEFAEYCGTDYCVGVNSGTAALGIMLRASGIGPGDEVIVPAHTFIATALAVVHAGAEPVCVEVERGTGLIDPAAITAAIGPRTAAILPVHLYGQVCQMDAIAEIAGRCGLAVFEDAAQAHGATFAGRRAGGFGRAAAFSFYPSKNLGALGDGGAICTDDRALATEARRYSDLGRAESGAHIVAGFNERLDGLQAALLRVKLPHLERWNEARRELAAGYDEALADGIDVLEQHPNSPCIYHLYPVRVADRERLGIDLKARGVASGVHYPVAVPDQPALAQLAGADTPIARDWAAREISLPIFPEMTAGERDDVAAAVLAALT
jgi:dTDP-4-amino-4,6-dideoxygalactose transaminase